MNDKQCKIVDVTKGAVDLTIPPDGEKFRYGSGFPFQVGPNTAGVFANLRFEGFPVGDFEAGMDVVLFDDLENISLNQAVQITRSKQCTHPKTGKPRVVVKHGQKGGFVPFGAKRADGSPHPAAGTGFLLGQALNFPRYGNGYYKKEDKTKDMIRCLELNQLVYDGETFGLVEQEVFGVEDPLGPPGSPWKILAPALGNAIADGDDLLYGLVATKGDIALWSPGEVSCGLSRWQYREGRWRPVSYVPVAHSRKSEDAPAVYGQVMNAVPCEPSVVRDLDGSLLFTVRGVYSDIDEHMIRVWRSSNGGESWSEIIAVRDVKAQAPITINNAADGTPYIVSNKPAHERDWLCMWPLNADRTGLEEPITVRNALEEFGPPPSGLIWFMDHPGGANVRLADDAWHSLLCYRLMDRGEHAGRDPTPFTGLYVEEVISSGPAIPTWNFD